MYGRVQTARAVADHRRGFQRLMTNCTAALPSRGYKAFCVVMLRTNKLSPVFRPSPALFSVSPRSLLQDEQVPIVRCSRGP